MPRENASVIGSNIFLFVPHRLRLHRHLVVLRTGRLLVVLVRHMVHRLRRKLVADLHQGRFAVPQWPF